MSQTLFRFGLPEPPRCRGWRTPTGRTTACTSDEVGQVQCGACQWLEQHALKQYRALTTRRLQTTTFGPAPAGTDPWRGFDED